MLEKPLTVFTYSLSAFLGISLGTVLSPSPWQSTLEAIHVHLCGHPPTGIQLAELQKLRIIPRHRNALLPPDNMVLDRFSGYKSEREQPALKDEMPLRRKGKRKQEALSTAQGNPPLPSSPEHQQSFKGAREGHVRWKKVGNCLSGSGFFLLSTNGTRRQIV